MARDLGVTSEIPEQPAIALGAVEITVEEMVGAFSTFANQGVYIKPTFITRIEDKNGIVLDQVIPESKDVMNKDVAYAIVKLMEGVTQSGTGQSCFFQRADPPGRNAENNTGCGLFSPFYGGPIPIVHYAERHEKVKPCSDKHYCNPL